MREAAGAYEIAQYARYEVSGPGAEAWLDHLVAGRIPSVGRIRLTPMLNPAGRLMGDLTVARLDEDRFWLTGSYYLQPWHMRWFHQHLPPSDVDGPQHHRRPHGVLGVGAGGARDRREAHAGGPRDRRVPVPRRAGDGGRERAGRGRTDLADRRARLRDRRAARPASRPVDGAAGRRRERGPAPDRRPRGRQPAPGEGLRDLVGRVPAGEHAGRGGARPVRRVRQGRLRRARGRAARP